MKRFPLLDSDLVRARWSSCKPALEPPKILEQAETRAAVFNALEQIPTEDRDALLAWCDFPDVPRIAEQALSLNLPRQTLYYRRDRAIRRLRRDFNRGGITQ